MPCINLTTYQDLVEHLLDYLGANATREAARDCRRAALAAYRDFSTAHRWTYYFQRGRVVTNAMQNTGSVEYIHTGSTYERQLTLTGATWPSWAALGQIEIGNIVYQVASRISDTVITLEIRTNPGADLAAGTTYTLFRDGYPLPADFLAADEVINANSPLGLTYEHPRIWLNAQRIYKGPAVPHIYSFAGDENYFGVMAVKFYPPPDQAYQMDFLYQRRPRPLLIEQERTGTASLAANVAMVTGSGTAFADKMVGSVFRFSSNKADYPTGLAGANPFADARIVTAVASATSLTLDSAPPNTYTGVKYTISDPLDIEEGAMLTALLRCAEAQSTISRIMKNEREARLAYLDALISAREADSRSFEPRVPGTTLRPYRLRDMPRGPDVS